MSFQTVHIEYLTPSRTIETIELRNKQQVKRVYVYNYEGYSFRLFETAKALRSFFSNETELYLHFHQRKPWMTTS